jgi:hypothetical protein
MGSRLFGSTVRTPREPLANHAGGDAGRDYVRGERLSDDRTGCHDRAATDVGEHDRRAPDPGTGADRDQPTLAALLADRPLGIVEIVARATRRNVDARPDEHIALEVHEPEVTARAHIDVLVKPRTRLREQRAEVHDRGRMAACEDTPEKGAAKILSTGSREQG